MILFILILLLETLFLVVFKPETNYNILTEII
jgi:hypothetical protein